MTLGQPFGIMLGCAHSVVDVCEQLWHLSSQHVQAHGGCVDALHVCEQLWCLPSQHVLAHSGCIDALHVCEQWPEGVYYVLLYFHV
jgi:hypothetical protein